MRAEAERAAAEYGLLVVLGLELTDNDEDPYRSARALAVGLESFASIEEDLVPALETARDQGAALVAAHPYSDSDPTPLRPTRRIWLKRKSLSGLLHRYEALQPA